MSVTDELCFDSIEPIVVPVTIGDRLYALREADGLAGARYRNALFSRAEVGPDGRMVAKGGLADIEALLVSACLFEATREGDGPLIVGEAVPKETIDKWPDRIISALYKRAKEVSELDHRRDKNPTPAGGPNNTPGGTSSPS